MSVLRQFNVDGKYRSYLSIHVNYSIVCPIFNGISIFVQQFIKPPSTKFHENVTSGKQDFTQGPTDGGTDREEYGHDKGSRRFRNNVNKFKIFIFKYKEQDATLHKLFISVKFSSCFRWFLRPSSGAEKLYIQHRVPSLSRQWQVAEKV